jgi:hypothetical protein
MTYLVARSLPDSTRAVRKSPRMLRNLTLFSSNFRHKIAEITPVFLHRFHKETVEALFWLSSLLSLLLLYHVVISSSLLSSLLLSFLLLSSLLLSYYCHHYCCHIIVIIIVVLLLSSLLLSYCCWHCVAGPPVCAGPAGTGRHRGRHAPLKNALRLFQQEPCGN